MTGIDSTLAIVGALLLAATAFGAAVETVVTRMNVVRALRLDEEDARGATALLWLVEHRATVLDALLLAAVVGRMAFAGIAVALGLRFGLEPVAVGGIVAGAAMLSLIFGEVVPRTIALRHLEGTGRALSRSARVFVRLLHPIVRVVVAIGRGVVPRRHEVSGPHASDDELRQLDVDEDEQDDEIEPEERAMIQSIFELADTIVREIMVPRPDMVAVSEDASLREVIGVVLDHGFSRLPVHDADDTDLIVGVVYAKDLLHRIATGQRGGRWGDLVRPPTYVPETKRGDELLRDLQAAAVHLAIVVDEYGEIVGLVTIEDILEEIVGEIVDEHDQELVLVEPLDHGGFRVDARLGVDDLNEILGADLPEDGWDTVGGLVFGMLGRVPVEGETIELDGIGILVERVQGRRVGKVLVTVSKPGAGDEDAADADGRPEARDPERDSPATKAAR